MPRNPRGIGFGWSPFRKQYTVKVGTAFEHGRIPLHKMLQAVYLMTSSKKGISAHQLHRKGIRGKRLTYKTTGHEETRV